MGLAEVQAALARLFTDERLRSRFFSDPRSVGNEIGLNPQEVDDLAGLSVRDVGLFAMTLRQKRVDDARKVLPLTSQVLGARFASMFLSAVDGPLPPARHRDDAREFARRLGLMTSVDPPWVVDLADYEAAFVELVRRRVCLAIRLYRYPVGWIIADLDRNESLYSIEPRATLGVWIRPGGRWRMRHLLL